MAGDQNAATQWTMVSVLLPEPGAAIDFVLEERDTPVRGVFANGVFHSRWAAFGRERVRAWRHASDDPMPTWSAAPSATTRRTWAAPLRRLVGRLLDRGNTATGTATGDVEPEPPAKPAAVTGRVFAARKRHPDSNQTTS